MLLVLGMAAALGGCRFWYKPEPVANAIGEERVVLLGDTLNAHREDRFEIYGPNAEAVYDGYEQMNRAVRAFERHFATRAPKIAVILSRGELPVLDSAAARDFRSRGFQVLPYIRPRGVRTRSNMRTTDYGGVLWPIAPSAARLMLARFADQRLSGGPGGTRSDTTALNRFPLWYRAAVIHLVGDAGTLANDVEYVRENRGRWQPLRNLFTLVSSPTADSLLDPARRHDADDHTRILAAQASTFGRYLSEREGPAVIGRIAVGYLAGRSINEMIAEFHTAPKTVEELESRWRAWIETREND